MAGELALRKYKEPETQMFIFLVCRGLMLFFLFRDEWPEPLTSEETRNFDWFWFAMRTVLGCTCNFLTDEAELALTSTLTHIDFLSQNMI